MPRARKGSGSNRNATATGEISECLGCTCTDSGELHQAIEYGTNPAVLMTPVYQTEGDQATIKLILQTQAKTLVTREGRYQAK